MKHERYYLGKWLGDFYLAESGKKGSVITTFLRKSNTITASLNERVCLNIADNEENISEATDLITFLIGGSHA